MKYVLQSLLDIDSALFRAGIKDLEKSTGYKAIDVRLIADMIEQSHRVVRKLGLDPKDTTGLELYQCLLAAVKRDDLEAIFGESDYTLTVVHGQVISFNLLDVIENAHLQLPYKKQVASHGQRALRGEIVNRYLANTRTNDDTVLAIARAIGLLCSNEECYNKHEDKKKK